MGRRSVERTHFSLSLEFVDEETFSSDCKRDKERTSSSSATIPVNAYGQSHGTWTRLRTELAKEKLLNHIGTAGRQGAFAII